MDENEVNNDLQKENNEMDGGENIISLKDENGKDVNFEFLDMINYENENYIVLLPADEDAEDGDEVVILKQAKVDQNSEEEEYDSVEDENILNAVFNLFKEKYKDEFEFIEDDDKGE